MCAFHWNIRCLSSYLPPFDILEKCLLPYFLNKSVNWMKKISSHSGVVVMADSTAESCKRPTSTNQGEKLCRPSSKGRRTRPNDLPPGLLRYSYAQYILVQRWHQHKTLAVNSSTSEESPALESPVVLDSPDEPQFYSGRGHNRDNLCGDSYLHHGSNPASPSDADSAVKNSSGAKTGFRLLARFMPWSRKSGKTELDSGSLWSRNSGKTEADSGSLWSQNSGKTEADSGSLWSRNSGKTEADSGSLWSRNSGKTEADSGSLWNFRDRLKEIVPQLQQGMDYSCAELNEVPNQRAQVLKDGLA